MVITPIQIRFSDVDLMGHVNNAVYLNYFESARMNYFRTLIRDQWDWVNFGILLGNNTVDYFKPLLLNDQVEIETKCLKIGNKSFVLEYILYVINGSKKTKYASGTSTLVCFNYNEKQTIPVPDKFKQEML
ncbi:MAG: acyl-CoA thioesterase [Crocinitomicaceae bacterium]|nr:acyl-CoA thioesterase [Crocinitomicaceae bacterium]